MQATAAAVCCKRVIADIVHKNFRNNNINMSTRIVFVKIVLTWASFSPFNIMFLILKTIAYLSGMSAP